MTDTPKKYSDGPTIIPGKPGEQDVFIAPPLPQLERPPKPGDRVLYGPVDDEGKGIPARIAIVRDVRLVDVELINGQTVRLVPLLHDGDPDPQSPMGRCTFDSAPLAWPEPTA